MEGGGIGEEKPGVKGQLLPVNNRTVFQKGNWLHPRPLTAHLDFRKQKKCEDESFYPSNSQYSFCVSLVAAALIKHSKGSL